MRIPKRVLLVEVILYPIIVLLLSVFLCGHDANAQEATLAYIDNAVLNIRDSRVEHIIAFDENGVMLFDEIGTANSAYPPKNARLYDTTVLHNHPNGSPFFSLPDLHFAATNNVQRMVLVAPVVIAGEKVYQVCTADRGDRMYWNQDIYSDYDPDSVHPDSYAVLGLLSKSSGRHKTWSDYYKRHNIYYHCEVMAR